MAESIKNVLLVEDEAILAMDEKQQLNDMGYAVHHVLNGEAAVESVLNSDSTYDLILMDINLGSGIDGTQAAERIVKEKDIPIVFLSSHTEPEVVEKTEKITSYGYVVKNSGPTVLDASIKMALKLYEAYRRYNQRNQELYGLAKELEESNEELISTEEELRQREASLTESDNRFRSVLQLVPDMISIHDPDMNILYSNWRGFADVPQAKRIIPAKCYKTYRDLNDLCPDCLAKTVLETGKPLRKEAELPEGMWVDIRAIPVLDESGNVTMFVEWVRDITEEKVNEKKLIHSEEEHRRLFETMSPGVVYHSADGTIIAANPAAEALLGLTADQMNGKTTMDPRWKMIDEEGRAVPGSEHPAMLALKTGKKVGPVDRAVFIPEEGTYIWLSITATPLFHPGDDQPYQVYATFDDITARRRAEEDLIRQNALLESIINGTPDILAIQNPDLTVERYNEAGYRMLGKTPDEVAGKKCYELIGFKGECEDCATRKALVSKKSESLEKYIPGLDIYLDCRSNPVLDQDGKVVQVVEQLRDITKRKRAEGRLRESEEAVRKKLDAILDPDGDIEALNLADIIDQKALQIMMEDFYSFSGIGSAIVDMTGKVLVAVGWQDICTKFHRVHPDTANNCLESDLALSEGVPAGTFKAYRCKNNMWDMVTPIEVGGNHLGNIFLGQFFFEDETLDYEIFRQQAREYGFDEAEYLAALDRVPRWSRESVKAVMMFYSRLAGMISSLSYSKIKLSRDVAELRRTEEALSESEEKHRRLFETSAQGVIYLSDDNRIISANPAAERILGLSQDRMLGKNVVSPQWKMVRQDGSVVPDTEHPSAVAMRTGRAVGPVVCGVFHPEKNDYIWLSITAVPQFRKGETKPFQIYSIFEDITESRQANEKIKRLLSEKEILLREVHHRIKNNMGSVESLLSMQARSTNNAEVRTALQEALARVGSIRVVYEKLLLGKDYHEISVKDYTNGLIDSLIEVFPEHRQVTIEKRVSDFALSSKKVITLGIIMNELLTNAFKYAFRGKEEGHILIALDRAGNEVTLTIHDDGAGIDMQNKADRSTGFGFTIVKMLAEQLGGTCSVENAAGTKCVVTFEIT